MKAGVYLLVLLVPLGLLTGLSSGMARAAQDPDGLPGALIDDAGVELVQANCSICHALALVTSQRGDRQFWLNTIRWMQKTQNLWPIPAMQEQQILDYLAKNYNESEWGRRPPLSPALLPPQAPTAP